MRKLTILSLVVGAAMFVASNASAVMGTITLSGTSKFQAYSTNVVDHTNSEVTGVIKSYSVNQKSLLFFLEQGTEDTSITNKPTTIYYDPDASNAWATTWASGLGATAPIYGIFYYSNSMSGLVRLDGTNNLMLVGTNVTTGYYNFIELDCLNPDSNDEGFYNPDAMPSTSVYSESRNQENYTADGTAILYVHSNPYDFNLMGNWQNNGGYPPYYFFANNVNGFVQGYAAIVQGPATFTYSYSEKGNTNIESESITIKGTGDVEYNDNAGITSGTVTFKGKGPSEL